jgi:hypothetical protein
MRIVKTCIFQSNGIIWRRGFWARNNHFEKVFPPALSASDCHWGMKDAEAFRCVPAWGHPPRPDLRKYVTGFTLRAIIDNYKPNAKSHAIGGPLLYAPTTRITAHGPPLHSTTCRRDLRLITSQPPFSGNTSGWHNQTNGYTAVGESMLPGPQPGHCVGVRNLWPMVPHLGLHTGAMSRVHSTFISAFSVQTHKLEATPKPWDRTIEKSSLLMRQELHNLNDP